MSYAKFSVVFICIIRYLPPSILMTLVPSLKGLVVFRRVSLNVHRHAVNITKFQALEVQISNVKQNPKPLDGVPHRVVIESS